jgi:hypothetical protein
MVSAKFNKETGILDSTFSGDVRVEEIIEYIDATKNNNTYPRLLKILTDATSANMIFEPEDIPKIVRANFQSLEKYDYIIDGIVVSSALETALTVLYQQFSRTNKYRFQMFSTREAAENWLEVQVF